MNLTQVLSSCLLLLSITLNLTVFAGDSSGDIDQDLYQYEYTPILFITEVEEVTAESTEVMDPICILPDDQRLKLCQDVIGQQVTSSPPASPNRLPLVGRLAGAWKNKKVVMNGTTPGLCMKYSIMYTSPDDDSKVLYKANNSIFAYKCPTNPPIYLRNAAPGKDKSVIVMAVEKGKL